jgi:hypothetical protein
MRWSRLSQEQRVQRARRSVKTGDNDPLVAAFRALQPVPTPPCTEVVMVLMPLAAHLGVMRDRLQSLRRNGRVSSADPPADSPAEYAASAFSGPCSATKPKAKRKPIREPPKDSHVHRGLAPFSERSPQSADDKLLETFSNPDFF